MTTPESVHTLVGVEIEGEEGPHSWLVQDEQATYTFQFTWIGLLKLILRRRVMTVTVFVAGATLRRQQTYLKSEAA